MAGATIGLRVFCSFNDAFVLQRYLKRHSVPNLEADEVHSSECTSLGGKSKTATLQT